MQTLAERILSINRAVHQVMQHVRLCREKLRSMTRTEMRFEAKRLNDGAKVIRWLIESAVEHHVRAGEAGALAYRALSVATDDLEQVLCAVGEFIRLTHTVRAV